MKTKPNIHKINSNIIKNNWRKTNIELLGYFKRGYRCDTWYNKFRFIEEDYTIKSTLPAAPVDRNGVTYCNSYYVAQYLNDGGGITKEVLDEYEKQLNRLAQGQVIC